MILSLFLSITWLVIWSFVTIKNKIPVLENIYIFLLVLLIEINVNWIIIDELKKIQVSQQTEKYISYLLFRTIIFPLTINIFINVFASRKSLWGKIFTTACTSFVLTFIEILFISLGIFNFTNWKLYYSILHILIMHALGYCLFGTYSKIIHIGVH